jgi:hypothetical protein
MLVHHIYKINCPRERITHVIKQCTIIKFVKKNKEEKIVYCSIYETTQMNMNHADCFSNHHITAKNSAYGRKSKLLFLHFLTYYTQLERNWRRSSPLRSLGFRLVLLAASCSAVYFAVWSFYLTLACYLHSTHWAMSSWRTPLPAVMQASAEMSPPQPRWWLWWPLHRDTPFESFSCANIDPDTCLFSADSFSSPPA